MVALLQGSWINVELFLLERVYRCRKPSLGISGQMDQKDRDSNTALSRRLNNRGLQVLTHSFRKSSPDPGFYSHHRFALSEEEALLVDNSLSAGQLSPWQKWKAVQMKSKNPEPEESQSRILRHLVSPSAEPLCFSELDKKRYRNRCAQPIRIFARSLRMYWLTGYWPEIYNCGADYSTFL